MDAHRRHGRCGIVARPYLQRDDCPLRRLQHCERSQRDPEHRNGGHLLRGHRRHSDGRRLALRRLLTTTRHHDGHPGLSCPVDCEVHGQCRHVRQRHDQPRRGDELAPCGHRHVRRAGAVAERRRHPPAVLDLRPRLDKHRDRERGHADRRPDDLDKLQCGNAHLVRSRGSRQLAHRDGCLQGHAGRRGPARRSRQHQQRLRGGRRYNRGERRRCRWDLQPVQDHDGDGQRHDP